MRPPHGDPNPTSLLTFRGSYLTAIGVCGELPWIYSNFAAADTYYGLESMAMTHRWCLLPAATARMRSRKIGAAQQDEGPCGSSGDRSDGGEGQ